MQRQGPEPEPPDGVDETEYLLRDPVNAARLLESIERLERGEGIQKTFEELGLREGG